MRNRLTAVKLMLANSAGKRHGIVELEPGPHEVSAMFFAPCVHSEKAVKLNFVAAPGKQYRLKSMVDLEENRWHPEIAEYKGEPIESDYPWTQAMCASNVTVL